jgi:hypothetical protein
MKSLIRSCFRLRVTGEAKKEARHELGAGLKGYTTCEQPEVTKKTPAVFTLVERTNYERLKTSLDAANSGPICLCQA